MKSSSFSSGNKNVFTPALIPPSIFNSSPPIAVIFPCKQISPVIAILFFIFLSVKRLYRQTVIAVPAEGPSFGVAPSGTCI